MPTRDVSPIGAPCWIELFTTQPDVTKAFYCDLFGWTVEETSPEYGGYFNFSKDGHGVAGGMTNDGQGAPDGWSIYLAADDINRVAEEAEAEGGSVIMAPMQVMALGSMAVLTDPGGSSIGAWQPGEHKGFELYGEPGSAGWFELHTRDYDKTVAWYQKVFKFDAHPMSDSPEFRYTTYGEGENQLAGIMDAGSLPADAPLGWSIYFLVENTDKAVEQTQAAGGTVIDAAEDTPYGRLATVTDPTGIKFKLMAH